MVVLVVVIVIAIALAGALLSALLLVSLAVFREESRHSLAGTAPGGLERSARRLLAVQARGGCHPIDRTQVRDAFDFPDQAQAAPSFTLRL